MASERPLKARPLNLFQLPRRVLALRLEQAVQVGHEIARVGVIDGRLRGTAPGFERLGVIGIDADDVDLFAIDELNAIGIGDLAAEYQMQLSTAEQN